MSLFTCGWNMEIFYRGIFDNHSRHRIILNLTKPIKIFDVDYGPYNGYKW